MNFINLQRLFVHFIFFAFFACFASAQELPEIRIVDSETPIRTNLENDLSISFLVNNTSRAPTTNDFVAKIDNRILNTSFVKAGENLFSFLITQSAIIELLGASVSREIVIEIMFLVDGEDSLSINTPGYFIDLVSPRVNSVTLLVLEMGVVSEKNVFTTGETVRASIAFSEEISASSPPPMLSIFSQNLILQKNTATEWDVEIEVPDISENDLSVEIFGGSDRVGNILDTYNGVALGAILDIENPVIKPIPELHITELNYLSPEYTEIVNLGPTLSDISEIMFRDNVGTRSIEKISSDDIVQINPNEIFIVVKNSDKDEFQSQFPSYSGKLFTTTVGLNNLGDSANLVFQGEDINSVSYSSNNLSDGQSLQVDLSGGISIERQSVGEVYFSLPPSIAERTFTRSIIVSEDVELQSNCSISPISIASEKVDITFSFNSDGVFMCSLTGTDPSGHLSNSIEYSFLINTTESQSEIVQTQEMEDNLSNVSDNNDITLEKNTNTNNPQIDVPVKIDAPTKRIIRRNSKRPLRVPKYKPSIEIAGIVYYYPIPLSRNVFLNDFGKDVYLLQKFLTRKGFLFDNQITSTFDNNTYRAVIEYQDKNFKSLLVPFGISKGTGFVDTATREHINNARNREFENIAKELLKFNIFLNLFNIKKLEI